MKITVNGVVIDNPRSLSIRCELAGDETLEGVDIAVTGGTLRIIPGAGMAGCVIIRREDSSEPAFFLDTEGQPEADVPAIVSAVSGANYG